MLLESRECFCCCD